MAEMNRGAAWEKDFKPLTLSPGLAANLRRCEGLPTPVRMGSTVRLSAENSRIYRADRERR